MRVDTPRGRLEGYVREGVAGFLGIPFAEPPFGENRLRPPRRVARWEGARDATRYGPICPQAPSPMDGGLPAVGEDCLNLNVWTPDPGARGLPVMVFAHGGGQVGGAGSTPLYDGARLAREGVVVVTNNRRLGAEGFMYLGEHFDDERGAGNLGILDQLAALEWVQENIEGFGGDPGRVTLFGESGGGATTGAVIAHTGSNGLLHRAIPQSGGHGAHTREHAAEITRSILDLLGIEPRDFDAMVATPWQRYVELYPELNALERESAQVFLPVVTDAMPHHPVDATWEGRGRDLDLLIGTCRDEASLFGALLPSLKGSPFDRRARRVIEHAGASWDDVVRAYTRARPNLSEPEAETAILGDLWFRAPSIRIAEGHAHHAAGRTFMYLFTWESPRIGAAHGLDLMLFGNGIPFEPIAGDAPHERTETLMREIWTRFARTGNPAPEGLEFPAYESGERLTFEIDESPGVLADPYAIERAALGRLIDTSWTELKL